ncbi:hypothetical protein [Micromonospora sp. NPDC050695]
MHGSAALRGRLADAIFTARTSGGAASARTVAQACVDGNPPWAWI